MNAGLVLHLYVPFAQSYFLGSYQRELKDLEHALAKEMHDGIPDPKNAHKAQAEMNKILRGTILIFEMGRRERKLTEGTEGTRCWDWN